jgi:predicted dehydrogenase
MDDVYYQRDYVKRLNVGLVGIGHHSYRTLLPALHHLPVTLRAVSYSSDRERAERTAAEFGCRAYKTATLMYESEDLDAVFICVSPERHPQLVVEALDAGLHVWVEKPPAMRATEIQEMICHRNDRIVVVGFKKAFMPVADKAREIVRLSGGLRTILAVYPMSIPSDGPAVLAGGQFVNWLGNGIHPISFVIAMGGPARAVTVHTGPGGHGTCVIELKSGVIATIHLGSGPHPMEQYALFGDDWHCNIPGNDRLEFFRDYGPHDRPTFLPEGLENGAIVWQAQSCLSTIDDGSLFREGIYAEMREFCESILSQTKPVRGSLEFALDVMKVYEAGLTSQGQTVEIV